MKTFALPDLGEGLQDAEIVAWHVAAGDRVTADQPLVSVETAKAVVEVPSPWSGRVAALRAEPGEVVPIGAALVDIDTDDEVRDSGTVVGALPVSGEGRAGAKAPRTAVPAPPRGKASPAVRRIAADLSVDISALAGTGPGGVITRSDVETAARTAPAAAGFEPLRGVRRAMAEAMEKASATVVAASVTDEAIIESWPADANPTMRLVRAIVAGCRAAPELNAWYDPARRSRRLHEGIDLGIAVDTDDGLFAPVLRDIGGRTEEDLRAGLGRLKADVRARSVPLAELRGQTFTLSNFGMLGGLTAVLTIMPPQVAILGAGRIHQAIRSVGGDIRSVRVLPLSLTFDHRAVTGAEAIRFLTAVIRDLTTP